MGNENKIPRQFEHKTKASLPICFTVPLLANSKIRGLNIFSVYALTTSASRLEGNYILEAPVLTVIKNKSKGLRWIYVPSCWGIPSNGEDVIWLSYWNFGNQLEPGDHVSVLVLACRHGIQVREWGFRVVYEPVKKMFSQHNTDLNVIGGDLSELYLLIPGTYLLYGGPIESCRTSQRLIGKLLLNFSGLIAYLNRDTDAEVDWQRLLFGEELVADALWQAVYGEVEVDWQRLFREEFCQDCLRLFEADADWQRVYGEASVKKNCGLIANSNVDAEADVVNEDWQQSEGTLAVAPTGESQALMRCMTIDIIHGLASRVL